jgi:hypothetical protein
MLPTLSGYRRCSAAPAGPSCRRAVLAAPLVFLLGGCASFEDWAVRQQFLDRGYQRTILPRLLDIYHRKTVEPSPTPTALPAPADLDRG